MSSVRNYFSLVKFSHTIFAIPFAFIGFFMAVNWGNYSLNFSLLFLVLLDMVWARNAAMGFNRYIDRKIDAKNERTQVRDIPAGKISKHSALIFVIINSLLFLLTTFFINKLTFFLAPVALLVILGYSYTKRFTALCHIILGIGIALSPIGAYLAVTGSFSIAPILLSFVVFFWVSGFDIIYALQDEEFDKKNNLKSIPVLLGKKKALYLSSILHFFSFVLLIYLGITYPLHIYYWIGVFVFSGSLLYQHLIISSTNLSKINLAFFTTNGVASVLFGLFCIIDLFWK
jgi:4-hydroxybenzoate polyprenyltransferase